MLCWDERVREAFCSMTEWVCPLLPVEIWVPLVNVTWYFTDYSVGATEAAEAQAVSRPGNVKVHHLTDKPLLVFMVARPWYNISTFYILVSS